MELHYTGMRFTHLNDRCATDPSTPQMQDHFDLARFQGDSCAVELLLPPS